MFGPVRVLRVNLLLLEQSIFSLIWYRNRMAYSRILLSNYVKLAKMGMSLVNFLSRKST